MANTLHRSTQRAIDIMNVVAESNDTGKTMTELSLLLDAPKSSLFSIIHTLEYNQLLDLNKDTGKYTIGPQAYLIGKAFLQEHSVFYTLQKIFEDLRDTCRETCCLGILKNREVHLVLHYEAPQPVKISKPEKPLPLHTTALGKALLCDKSVSELHQIFRMAFAAARITPPWILISS